MFFIYILMVLWALVVVGLFFGAFAFMFDGGAPLGIAMLIASVCAGVGWFYVAPHVWDFSDASPPPNGCYAVTNNTGVEPIVAGKVVTVVPYDDLEWVGIPCPAGIHP